MVLLVGLIHGLVYVFLLPPWQHYDEPMHFETVLLAARLGRAPAAEDMDPQLRRELAASMQAHGFYKGLGFKPDLAGGWPAWIGPASQIGNPILPYRLAALAIAGLSAQGLEAQLYAARLVSLLFYLLSLAAAWGATGELAPEGHPLRTLVPLSLALLPGYVDVMTGVNNDAAATAFMAVLVWSGLRLVQRGWQWLPFLGGLAATGLCLVSKETVYFAAPFFLLALWFSWLRGRWRKVAWIVIGMGILGGAFLAFDWGDAAWWYRSSSQPTDTRQANAQAPVGEYVFALSVQSPATPVWLRPVFQPLPPVLLDGAAGGKFTMGFWLWSEPAMPVNAVLFSDGLKTFHQVFAAGAQPQFIALHFDTLGRRYWLSLGPPASLPASGTLYLDGLVLVPGDWPLDVPPVFSAADGSRGEWGGRPFTNLLRNGSAEAAGPRIRQPLDDLGALVLPDDSRPSLLLTYLLDWRGAGWFYRLTAERLLRTFWSQFGWGHVDLLGSRPYRWLGWITLLGALSASLWLAVHAWRRRSQFPWEAAFILGVLLLLAWGGAFVRGSLHLGVTRLYLPVARYAYAAVLPTIGLLALGWWQALQALVARLKGSRMAALAAWGIYLGAWLFLDVLSILSLLAYYGGR